MLKKIFTAAISALALNATAYASDLNGANTDLPGSVFVIPDTETSAEAPAVDPNEISDIMSDIEIFRKKGFLEPNWHTYSAEVDDVLKNVVLPDWKSRTGNSTDPELPSIDIAAEMLLGGKTNDLLVMSRLPGDCGPEGCLLQVYSLVNDVWVKRFEFTTVAVAWKMMNDGTPMIAAVGGMWIPSRTYRWIDGKLQGR